MRPRPGQVVLLVQPVTSWPNVPAAVLPGHEQSRAEALDGLRRDEYVSGRVLARTACGLLLSMPPARVPIEIAALGRPELRPSGRSRGDDPDLSMSISHAGGMVTVALTASGRAGADIEPVTPPPSGAVRWSCSPEEAADLATLDGAAKTAAFLRLWTAKEACLKAAGTGIRRRLSSIPLGVRASGHWGRTWWRTVSPAPGLVGAVAVAGGQGATVPRVSVLNLPGQKGLS